MGKDGRINYFTNLDAWRLEKIQAQGRDPIASDNRFLEDVPPENDELSDLPF